jgi:hypothetical protein
LFRLDRQHQAQPPTSHRWVATLTESHGALEALHPLPLVTSVASRRRHTINGRSRVLETLKVEARMPRAVHPGRDSFAIPPSFAARGRPSEHTRPAFDSPTAPPPADGVPPAPPVPPRRLAIEEPEWREERAAPHAPEDPFPLSIGRPAPSRCTMVQAHTGYARRAVCHPTGTPRADALSSGPLLGTVSSTEGRASAVAPPTLDPSTSDASCPAAEFTLPLDRDPPRPQAQTPR